MANDIEINVRVANQTSAGLTSVNAALRKLKGEADKASDALRDLRTLAAANIDVAVSLDDRTQAGVAAVEAAITRLKALAADIPVSLDDQTASGIATVTAAVTALQATAAVITVSVDDQSSTELARITALVAAAGATSAVIDVRLDDHTGPDVAAIQAALTALRAQSPIQLEARFTGDAAAIAATAVAVRNLRTNAGSANTALTSMTPKALAAAAALTVLKGAAQDASNALRTLRGRVAATSAAMTDLRATTTSASSSLRTLSTRAGSADGRMETLSTRAHALTTNMDHLDGSLRRVGGSMAGLRGRVGSVGSSLGGAAGGSRKLMMAALALAPALVPIAAAVAPLVPALGAVGVAMGVFGAALLPQILAMGKLGEAHKAYKEAVEESGQTSTEAGAAQNAWLKEVSKATPEVRNAAAALSVMKDEYKGWTDSLAGDTLPVATKSFAVLGALFPRLTPLVKATSSEFSRLMNMMAVGVNSKGFDEFMVKLADFSQRTLRAAVDGMVKFGQAMNRGIQSDGFREFLAYVRESGPIVGETLANLGRALGKLIAAAADTGIGILTVVNAFAQLVNALPTEMVSVLLQMAFAIKALQLVTTGLAPAFMAAAAGASGFVRAARFGGVSSAIAGVTASLTAMQRASIVLAVLTAVVVGINALAEKAKGAPPDVDRLTTSLKNLGRAGQFTGELKKTFGDMDGFVAKVKAMQRSSQEFDGVKKFTSLMPMGGLVDKLTPKLDQLVNGTRSLGALKDHFKAFDESFASLAKGGHADEAATQFRRFEEALKASGLSTAQITALFPQYQAAVGAIAADQEMAARSMGYFGDQAVAVQAKLDLQRQSAEGLRQSINALNEVYLQARGGVRGMEAAIDAATASLKENGRTLDENTEKGRANNQALDNLAGATMKAAEAALVNGQGWEAAQAIWERGRGQLLASAQAMGLTEAQAASLADQILATPDKTAVLRGNMEDLQAKLDAAKAQLASVPDSRKAAIRAEIADLESKLSQARSLLGGMKTDYWVRVHYQQIGYIPSGGHQFEFAHGGIIGAAGGGPRSRMTLVGEQGPELVDLAPGSRVRSNPDSKRIADGMAGGGGGTTVLEIRSSGSRIDDLILEILRRAVRVKGGNVQLVVGSSNR